MAKELDKNKYYVYEHWLDNKCFYVGSGNYKRPFWFYRQEAWHDHVGDRKDEIDVKIIQAFETRLEAYDFEKALTIYHDYILNDNLINVKSGNALYGEDNPMYRKSIKDFMNEEEYDKWLENFRGKKASLETRQKMSKTRSGQKRGKYKTRKSGISPITAHFLDTGEEINFPNAAKCYKYFEKIVSKPLILASIRGEEPAKIKKLNLKFTQEVL